MIQSSRGIFLELDAVRLQILNDLPFQFYIFQFYIRSKTRLINNLHV